MTRFAIRARGTSLVFWGALSCCAAATGSALADSPSDLERAKESFRAGATAYAAGDYLAAIQALDAAYQLTPLPAIAFSLAQAERRQYFVDHGSAHLLRAISLYRRYIDVAPNGSRRADALEGLSQLEPLAAVLVQPKPNAPARAPHEPERRTRVLITADAPGARLFLDGLPSTAAPLIREVEPGKHHVEARAPGFYSSERDISAVTGELTLTQFTLREQPSLLSVWTSPEAEIYVDGSYISAGGDGVLVQVSSGKHRVAVAQKGHRVGVKEVTLERGKAKSIRVDLEPTGQRLAADAMFIAGGAALGSSLVLSALAIRAENQAEQFLGESAHHNVSSADLIHYNNSIIDRDRYRLGTGVALASSAGFFITGLFLHVLDQPDPQLLYRSGPRVRPESPAPAPKASLHVAPLAFGAGLGAMIGGEF